MTEQLGLEGSSGNHPVQIPAKAGSAFRLPETGNTGTCPGGSGMSPERESP